jgi:hypothetical protein
LIITFFYYIKEMEWRYNRGKDLFDVLVDLMLNQMVLGVDVTNHQTINTVAIQYCP